MAREPEKPARFTKAELELLKATLDGYAQTLNRAVTYADASDSKELWIFKKPSLHRGLKYLRPFIEAVEQSLAAAAAGEPITESTRKSSR